MIEMLLCSYGDKCLILNRYGPGGGTRRLHQWGRNRIDVRGMGQNFARNGTNVIGPNFIIANDNEMALAA